MSEWLTKAADALKGEKAAEPQPFDIDCECGMHHSGLRRRRHQRIVCRGCGTALFVLPRDAYPVPVRPVRKKRKRKRKAPADRSPAVAPTQAAVTFGRDFAERTASEVARASSRMAAGTQQAGRSVWGRLSAVRRAIVGFWTPFRLVLLGILAAVTLTAMLTLRSGSQDTALSDLKRSAEAGRVALAEQDFAAAAEQFALAADALDVLDRHEDPLALEIRQLHRETEAMAHRLPESLFEIVSDAEAAHAADEWDEFQRRFELRYRHRWLVLEAPVQRVGRGSRGGIYRVDVPVTIGESGRRLTIAGRIPALDDLKFRDGRRIVILGGRVHRLELSKDRRVWTVRLDPDSAFLWASPENYAALGMTFHQAEQEEQVRRTLAIQARLNGLSSDYALN